MLPLIIALTLMVVIFGLPSYWVRRIMRKYSEPADRYPGTGGELARHMLDQLHLSDVLTEVTDTGDHYDPESRAVRLSKENFDGRSLTAVTVAAHEVGHALQHRDGFPPFMLRQRLVKVSVAAQKLAGVMLLLTPLLMLAFRSPRLAILTLLAGVLSMFASCLVHLVTLPTELDASFGRALPIMQEAGFLKSGDEPHARKVLRAAALTYVAASLVSVLNLSRWLVLLRR
ncbi:MAG: zinc metallopeptidase [Gammaproteobacteria bacterium]|jgi:Zn-dependent membrane protease YugP|nr:zinc metallopeptidase [Gammaproteobacteria bacterium]